MVRTDPYWQQAPEGGTALDCTALPAAALYRMLNADPERERREKSAVSTKQKSAALRDLLFSLSGGLSKLLHH
jgi:hypothetical protein